MEVSHQSLPSLIAVYLVLPVPFFARMMAKLLDRSSRSHEASVVQMQIFSLAISALGETHPFVERTRSCESFRVFCMTHAFR